MAREISGDRVHRYTLALEKGQYLDLPVRQKGVDVEVVVLDPHQQELLLVNSPNGKQGIEQVMLVAPETGSYAVTVSTGKTRSGSYEIGIAALRQATDSDHHRANGVRLLNLGQKLRRQGRSAFPDAVLAYRQALDAWRSAGEPAWQAETLDRIGQIHERMGQKTEALRQYQLAADVYRGMERHDEEAAVLNRIGRVRRATGEFQQALESYQLALRRHQTTGNRQGQATVLNNMALLYKSVGEVQKALDLYNNALALWRGLDSPARAATTLTNIGELYIAQGQFEFALDSLEEALRLRGRDNPRGRAITLSSLAKAHKQLGRMDLALDELEQALELRRRARDRRGVAVELNNLGNTYYDSRELQKALDRYQQALEAFVEVGDLQGAAYARLNIGWVYLDRGAAGEALALFDQTLPVFRRLTDPRGEASALFSIASAEASLESYHAARSHVEQSLDRIEDLRRGSHNPAARSSFLATKHHYFELMIDVLMRLHEIEPAAGHAAAAFAQSERSRARSLLETLAESSADVRQGVDASLIERERTLQAQLNLIEQDRLALESREPEGERAAALKEVLRDLVREYQELQGRIRVNSPKYAALTQPRALDAEEIQQVLDRDTVLLEYSLGDARSYLWLVSRSSIETFILPGRDQIEARARQVHTLLQSSARPDVTVQAELVTEALTDVLLGPVLDRLGSKRLLVVATGALQYLPFAALRIPDPDDDSRRVPLVLGHEVVSLPSASLLAVLRQELDARSPAPRIVAAIGDPVFQRADPRVKAPVARHTVEASAGAPRLSTLASLNALPFAGEEIRAILGLVPAEQRLEATGFDANRELVMSGALKDYRIIHFATHGMVDTTHPELSGIVLSMVDPEGRSRPGFLRAHELYNLDLPAELIVLSACRTALGQEVRGEGLIGLTQGFMYAGAARVIVTLWNVSDPSTEELMTRLYRGMLQEGLRPAAALRAAQVSMLREERWAAPYHWAPFVLQGEWR